jgi:uncharacterized membrane protein
MGPRRLGYVDLLRGFACLAMFQVHCYDSWLSPAAKKTTFYGWSRFGGILPAPLFLFLAGISVALVTERMRKKGVEAKQIAATTIRRGAEIFALALLFRVQEFVLGWPWSPWTDLLRVDVLNVIGVSIILMGVVCWIAQQGRVANTLAAAAVALGIAMATPPLWTTWRPRWLPWYLESYVNGVHNLDKPQSWLFPIFPWAAFAFAGLAVGLVLFSEWAEENPGFTVSLLGAGGVAIYYLSIWLDASPVHLYAVYDYWHTSPNFFLLRVALLLAIVFVGYAWCRWGAGEWGFSPLMQMGQTSLLVYWVHIEFVYGRLSILRKGMQTIPAATVGLLLIFAAMVLLSLARTRWKGRGAESFAWIRRPTTPVASG